MSSPISVTPRIGPPLAIRLNHPAWAQGVLLDDLDAAAQLGQQLLDAVKLLRYHAARIKGGRATKGISTPAKRQAARENGRRGGRPKEIRL